MTPQQGTESYYDILFHKFSHGLSLWVVELKSNQNQMFL